MKILTFRLFNYRNSFRAAPIVFSLIAAFFLQTAYAQYLPRFTQYREYWGLINPAALSTDFIANDGYYNLSLGLSYRREVFGTVKEAPNTQTLRGVWTPKSPGRFSLLLGGYFAKDSFGPTSFTGSFIRIGSFAYSSETFGFLSGAIGLGWVQFRLKASETSGLSPFDPLLAQDQGRSYLNLGWGLFYSKRLARRHDLYMGLSMPQAFDLNLSEKERGVGYKTEIKPHYYGLLGAKIYDGDYSFWEPSFWVKSLPLDRYKTHLDFNVRRQFRQSLWLGAGVSTQKVFHFEFGVHFWDRISQNNRLVKSRKTFLKIGVGYDYGFDVLPGVVDQAFEINLVLLFPKGK